MSDKKAPEIEGALQQIAGDLWGTDRGKSMDAGLCVRCQKVADDFKDEVSRKEYKLTGWCQECQDDFFGS